MRRLLWLSGGVLFALLLLVSYAVWHAKRPKLAVVDDTTADADAGVRIESAWKWGHGLTRGATTTSVEQRNREEFELIGIQRVPNVGEPPQADPAPGAVADARYMVTRGAWTAESSRLVWQQGLDAHNEFAGHGFAARVFEVLTKTSDAAAENANFKRVKDLGLP